MHPDWRDFLIQQGATITAGIAEHFSGTTADLNATAARCVLCDLGQFGILRVSGEDASSFLQNLLSNDIREVSATRAQYSCFNTAKGRLLASLLIWRDHEDFLLQLPRVLCEPLRKKLGMYVLRSKVTLADISDGIVSVGLSGTNIATLPGEDSSEFPAQRLGVADIGPYSVVRLDDTRLQFITTVEHGPALWALLRQQATPVGSGCWDWLNIRSGIPVILPQTQEQFVAQMINFELIGGISFNKGCYPGQEIVARTHYLGKLKRRMYLAHLDGHDSPQAGDELFSADMEGQACGMIVNAAPAPAGGYDLLAAVQIASRETQQIHWKTPHGEILQFLQQPYPLPD